MKKLTAAQIRRRMYELWQKAGFPLGRDDEFYLQAEEELLGEEKERLVVERKASP
ncbi:hypothetical protein NB311A_09951 [Nitrobacter sp. Nb-311A]|uniref:DUF2934 domain-containing protein n=1 Tax=Nitrobacter sp. Nb-311A TaxID=314253 RepID=UPI0000685FA4|nr:DUF2934 domain-containing protein [Nitrobacter sp. Nb-311A]EAQ33680.1 hypothetical protein NB311A_09951 [Nitrobacter sp. Nb-311A]